MNSTSLDARVDSRLSRLCEAMTQFFDHAQHAIVLLDPLRRREREHLLDQRDIDLEAHDDTVPRRSDTALTPNRSAESSTRIPRCGTNWACKLARFFDPIFIAL